MIVDDEPSLRQVVRRYLERRGWSVVEAGSAEEALGLLGEPSLRVDVVVVDLHLPGLSGGALCHRIPIVRPLLASRVLVASGDAEGAAEQLAAQGLRCPVLAKPFELDELARALDDIVSAA